MNDESQAVDSGAVPPEAARAESGSAPEQPRGWGAGRSGLIFPLIMVAFSTYFVVGNLTMTHADADFPGPTFFPWLLAIAGYVLAILLALHYLRNPEYVDDTARGTHRTYTDWVAVGWCVGGFALFALTLEFLGWILAGGLLFWCVARGIGSKRPIFDISLGLVVSSIIYLAFSVGLHLNLPSGLIGGGF